MPFLCEVCDVYNKDDTVPTCVSCGEKNPLFTPPPPKPKQRPPPLSMSGRELPDRPTLGPPWECDVCGNENPAGFVCTACFSKKPTRTFASLDDAPPSSSAAAPILLVKLEEEEQTPWVCSFCNTYNVPNGFPSPDAGSIPSQSCSVCGGTRARRSEREPVTYPPLPSTSTPSLTPTPNTPWICFTCGFTNTSDTDKGDTCGACGDAKTEGTRAERAQAMAEAKKKEEDEDPWICSECLAFNPPGTVGCHVCKGDRVRTAGESDPVIELETEFEVRRALAKAVTDRRSRRPWACPACSSVSTDPICLACGTPRVDGEARSSPYIPDDPHIPDDPYIPHDTAAHEGEES